MAEALRTAAPRASEQRIRRTLGYSDMRASFELSPSAPSVADKEDRQRGCPRQWTKAESGGVWIQAPTLLGTREVVGTAANIPRPCRAAECPQLYGAPPARLGKPEFSVFFGTPRGLGLATATTSAGLLAAPRERVRLQRTGPASRMGCIGVPIEQENRDAHEQGIRRRN